MRRRYACPASSVVGWGCLGIAVIMTQFLIVSNVPPVAVPGGVVSPPIPLGSGLRHMVAHASVVVLQPLRAVVVNSSIHSGRGWTGWLTRGLIRYESDTANALVFAGVSGSLWTLLIWCVAAVSCRWTDRRKEMQPPAIGRSGDEEK